MTGDDDRVEAGIHRIEEEMRRIVSGESDPYEAGRRIWGDAFSLAPESKDLMWPLWLMWGALTDRIEVKLDKPDEGNRSIRQAAAEWLSMSGRTSARGEYFEKWLYQELGYERPSRGDLERSS